MMYWIRPPTLLLPVVPRLPHNRGEQLFPAMSRSESNVKRNCEDGQLNAVAAAHLQKPVLTPKKNKNRFLPGHERRTLPPKRFRKPPSPHPDKVGIKRGDTVKKSVQFATREMGGRAKVANGQYITTIFTLRFYTTELYKI